MRGDRLKQRREQLGLSQDDLGAMVGKLGRQISRYENTTFNNIQAENLVEFAVTLEVSSDWLLGLTAEPPARLTAEPLTSEEWRIILESRKGLQKPLLDFIRIAHGIQEGQENSGTSGP